MHACLGSAIQNLLKPVTTEQLVYLGNGIPFISLSTRFNLFMHSFLWCTALQHRCAVTVSWGAIRKEWHHGAPMNVACAPVHCGSSHIHHTLPYCAWCEWALILTFALWTPLKIVQTVSSENFSKVNPFFTIYKTKSNYGFMYFHFLLFFLHCLALPQASQPLLHYVFDV